MISRAIKAGVPFAWFTADEAYGQAKWLQAWLEDHDISYVMAIRCRDTVTTGAGEQRADVLIAALSPQCWQRISAGAGAHGRREHRWARIPVRSRWRRGRGHWLLARRSARSRRDLLLRLLRAPPHQHRRAGRGRGQPLAHRRMLPAGQGRGRAGPLPGPHLAGLVCPHQVVDACPDLAGRQQSPRPKRGTGTSDPGMIGYTLAEIRRLLTRTSQQQPPNSEHTWSWSRWRRRRQYQARACHYRRRGYVLT